MQVFPINIKYNNIVFKKDNKISNNKKNDNALKLSDTKAFLFQLPNVNFKGKIQIENKDRSKNYSYSKNISEEEQYKSYLLDLINENKCKGDYVEALKNSLRVAKICEIQGNNDDKSAFEDNAMKIYHTLSTVQKAQAKSIMAQYNQDMATSAYYNKSKYSYVEQDNIVSSDLQTEALKYSISEDIDSLIQQGDYLGAISKKIELAKICKEQGKLNDAFMLEEGVRELYCLLNADDKFKAKDVISQYNEDMAKYINDDLEIRQ